MKRYGIVWCHDGLGMDEHEHGPYVLHADAYKLEAEVARLREAIRTVGGDELLAIIDIVTNKGITRSSARKEAT